MHGSTDPIADLRRLSSSELARLGENSLRDRPDLVGAKPQPALGAQPRAQQR
jgi:hypothetical protein